MSVKEDVARIIEECFETAKEAVKNNSRAEYFKELRNKYKYICIFGMGSLGGEMLRMMGRFDVPVDFVCDNNYESVKATYKGEAKLITFDELCKYKDECLVFVSPSNGVRKINDAINGQLNDAGFKNVVRGPLWKNMAYMLQEIVEIDKDDFLKNIMTMLDYAEDAESKELIRDYVEVLLKDYRDIDADNIIEKWFEPKHYFPDFLKPRKDECFVDGGAFCGDTFVTYNDWTNGEYEKYYGFELEDVNRSRLEAQIKKVEKDADKYRVYPYGLYDKYEKVEIVAQNDGSHISDTVGANNEECLFAEVNALDECLKGKKVTFIKMDIENSEIPAIHGAEHIIKEQKPLCAISMYHGLKQFMEIPILLKKLNPDYRIRYRVHSSVGHDVVCYAVDKNDVEHLR